MDSAPALSRAARSWLIHLADPANHAPRSKGHPPWVEIAGLVAQARKHGVLPYVLRNLAGLARAEPPDPTRQRELTIARASFAAGAGFTLLLSHHATHALAALHARGLRAIIVKGPVFARRIYPDQALRSFTDIDILIPPADRAEAGQLLAARDFQHEELAYRSGRDYAEDKWVLREQPHVMIELHSDLVHNPKLRHALNLDYEAVLWAGAGDPEDATRCS